MVPPKLDLKKDSGGHLQRIVKVNDSLRVLTK